MSKFRAILLAAMACSLAGFAGAETLQIGSDDTRSQFEHPGKPSRGMTQASVEAKFGQPASRDGVVGDPPITRWSYAEFVVFFEYDRVIHAVTRR